MTTQELFKIKNTLLKAINDNAKKLTEEAKQEKGNYEACFTWGESKGMYEAFNIVWDEMEKFLKESE